MSSELETLKIKYEQVCKERDELAVLLETQINVAQRSIAEQDKQHEDMKIERHNWGRTFQKDQEKIDQLRAELEQVQSENYKLQEQHKGCTKLVIVCDEFKAENERLRERIQHADKLAETGLEMSGIITRSGSFLGLAERFASALTAYKEFKEGKK